MATKTCLFCDYKANSVEHLLPEWVLLKVPPKTIRGFIGPHKNIRCNELTVKSVCVSCNTGWMSDLETVSTPLMSPLIDGASAYLDLQKQKLLATWAIKTAMVVDSMTIARNRPRFYTQQERIEMRASHSIPSRSFVWIGRYLNVGLAAESGVCRYAIPGYNTLYTGLFATFVLGALAIQTLTMRVPEENGYGAVNLTPAKGPWDEILCSVWPNQTRIYWPPVLAFDDRVLPIRSLHARWRIGMDRNLF